MGYIELSQKNYVASEQHFKAAIDASKGSDGDPITYLRLAIAQDNQKKYSDAAGYFSLLMPLIERESRARVSAPLVADAYEKYGLALAETGKPEEAEARRREALVVRQNNPKPAPAGSITPYGEKCPRP